MATRIEDLIEDGADPEVIRQAVREGYTSGQEIPEEQLRRIAAEYRSRSSPDVESLREGVNFVYLTLPDKNNPKRLATLVALSVDGEIYLSNPEDPFSDSNVTTRDGLLRILIEKGLSIEPRKTRRRRNRRTQNPENKDAKENKDVKPRTGAGIKRVLYFDQFIADYFHSSAGGSVLYNAEENKSASRARTISTQNLEGKVHPDLYATIIQQGGTIKIQGAADFIGQSARNAWKYRDEALEKYLEDPRITRAIGMLYTNPLGRNSPRDLVLLDDPGTRENHQTTREIYLFFMNQGFEQVVPSMHVLKHGILQNVVPEREEEAHTKARNNMQIWGSYALAGDFVQNTPYVREIPKMRGFEGNDLTMEMIHAIGSLKRDPKTAYGVEDIKRTFKGIWILGSETLDRAGSGFKSDFEDSFTHLIRRWETYRPILEAEAHARIDAGWDRPLVNHDTYTYFARNLLNQMDPEMRKATFTDLRDGTPLVHGTTSHMERAVRNWTAIYRDELNKYMDQHHER
ncbi:TPA: hypothetical protein HA278_07450 [Candidatus Woesearchaeota archaeon]|nr:hypothetical protein [Candidatus Woesearchaeota archaeon]